MRGQATWFSNSGLRIKLIFLHVVKNMLRLCGSAHAVAAKRRENQLFACLAGRMPRPEVCSGGL